MASKGLFNVNIINNGDGETGACQTSNRVTSPSGWSVSGTVTQTTYGNTQISYQTSTTPGPLY